jgi:CTP:molybdopterin cytidylyltransferase MocA
VILAAGASTRLGQPKQLVVLAGETLLERAVRTAIAARCAPVVVVLGAQSEQIRAGTRLVEADIVFNPEWAEGMASSIRVGIRAMSGAADGAVIMTCDQPLIAAAHVRALIERDPAEVTASAYAGRHGVPAYFPAPRFGELQALTGDSGARSLLQGSAALDCAEAECDVDTPAGLEALRRLLQPS